MELEYQEFLTEEDKAGIQKAYKDSTSDLSFLKPAKLYGTLQEDKGGQITFSELGIDAPLEVKVSYDPDQKKRQEIKQKLEMLLPKFAVQIGGHSSIDVTPKYINKAYGLAKLIEFLHMTKEDTLFIGDAIYPGGNDFSPKEAGFDCIKTNNPEHTTEIIKKILE